MKILTPGDLLSERKLQSKVNLQKGIESAWGLISEKWEQGKTFSVNLSLYPEIKLVFSDLVQVFARQGWNLDIERLHDSKNQSDYEYLTVRAYGDYSVEPTGGRTQRCLSQKKSSTKYVVP